MSEEETDKCRAVTKAALELIADQGFHGTPISQIAKKAGVGVGSIYRYFADKDELIHAIHARLEDRLHQALGQNHDPSLPARDQFIQLLVNLVEHLKENPLEFKFLEQYYNSPFGIEKMRKKFLEEGDASCEINQPFFKILLAGKGTIIKNLPGQLIHALAFGPAIFLVRDHLAGLITLDTQLTRVAAESCWDAIKI
jgi:AcrR family transcriptional regulator